MTTNPRYVCQQIQEQIKKSCNKNVHLLFYDNTNTVFLLYIMDESSQKKQTTIQSM